jgi:hypothetical protein
MIFKNRKSYFDKQWEVVFIHEDDYSYKLFGPLFKIYGIALSILTEKIILIDYKQIKNYTEDHIFAIEAHELGHFIAGHADKKLNESDEIEADVIGTYILLQNNKKIAANLLIERLNNQDVFPELWTFSDKMKIALKKYENK